MNYKGKELKEYTSSDPIFFIPSKHMVCWTNPADDPMECLVFSYDPRITLRVSARTPWNECRSFRHCAEIPEKYFSLVVVEHRAVSGINRYGIGKFVTREDAKSVMDSMVELLGGDAEKGSKDIYIVPFNAVRGFPYVAYDHRMDMDKIPDYLVYAYEEAMKKFLGEEDTGRPKIKDLRENVGISQKVETPRLESFKEQAAEELAREDSARDAESRALKNKLEADLVYKTGWCVYHCMKALQACGWKPDAAERMLKEKFKDFASNT